MIDRAIVELDGRNLPAAQSGRRNDEIQSRRRRFLAAMIERECSDEAVFPLAVDVRAKVDDRMTPEAREAAQAEVAKWAARESERLTKGAPLPVKIALNQSAFYRFRKSDTPRAVAAFNEAMDGRELYEETVRTRREDDE
ncbi:MAG: hypothetical protein OXI20_05380 [Rhodospirillales bacterium]|nr:hypothetical protein [Rhodospirillales bacterium]